MAWFGVGSAAAFRSTKCRNSTHGCAHLANAAATIRVPASSAEIDSKIFGSIRGTRFMLVTLAVLDDQQVWRERMDWNRIEGNWKNAKGKVKEKWGQLTDDDLAQINGRRDQLEGKIQQRYGLAKDLVRKDVDDWLDAQP
jgi:uncharacterized protein YjbJ (UPF0337 family)